MIRKTIHYFSDPYLDDCRSMTPEQILQYLEGFRTIQMTQKKGGSKLISLKIQEDLLESFRMKAKSEGIPYQTQIKKLMLEWVQSHESDF